MVTCAQQALLPLHDTLNHVAGTPTTWTTDTANHRIAFAVGVAVPEGQEAVINYGTKTNEQLLLHYGFTMAAGTAPDTVSLEVSLSEGRQRLLGRANLSTALVLASSDDLSELRAGACPYNRPCAQKYVGKSQSCMV